MSELSNNNAHTTRRERVLGPLARRLLGWVIVVSFINATIAISVQLYFDYKRDLDDVNNYLDFVRDGQVQGLAAAAWNFDRSLIKAQLDGIVESPWVAAAEVRYGKDQDYRVTNGELSSEFREVHEYPLEFGLEKRTVRVGTLFLQPDLAQVYQRTLDRGLTVILTQGGKALVFSLILLLLFYRLVTSRLVRVIERIRNYKPDTNKGLGLLTDAEQRADDELTVLIRALESAQARVEEFSLREGQQRHLLEAEVKRRTLHLNQALLEQQAIFDNSLTGIAFIRRQQFHRCNRSFEQMLGYLPHELVGKSAKILFLNQRMYEKEAANFRPVLLGGGTYSQDMELVCRDGTSRWFTVQLKGLETLDGEQDAVLTLHDITVRRESERALEQLARLDGLTGLANRRTLDSALWSACRNVRGASKGLSIAILDVDCFKQYNDHYGHSAGDDALRAVSGVLLDTARRPYDLAARYGGEEFVLMLPECDEPLVHLERMRQAVMDLAIAHEHSQAAGVLTISVGAVTVAPSEVVEPASVLAIADKLLYQAKHDGRNRVTWQRIDVELTVTQAVSTSG